MKKTLVAAVLLVMTAALVVAQSDDAWDKMRRDNNRESAIRAERELQQKKLEMERRERQERQQNQYE